MPNRIGRACGVTLVAGAACAWPGTGAAAQTVQSSGATLSATVTILPSLDVGSFTSPAHGALPARPGSGEVRAASVSFGGGVRALPLLAMVERGATDEVRDPGRPLAPPVAHTVERVHGVLLHTVAVLY